MTPPVVTLLTFVAAALAFCGVYSIAVDLFLRDRARVSQRLYEEFQAKESVVTARRPTLFKNLGKPAVDATEADARPGLRGRLENMLFQSGLPLTLRHLLAIAGITGLLLGAVGGLLRGSLFLAAIGVIVGTALPILYVHFRRARRLEKMMSQLPDAFELVARLVRAGQTTSQAFQGVADEFDPPLSTEFGYCYEQQNLGLAPELAMRDLARRVDLVEMKIFVLAVLVQRQTGGNLAELIDNLAGLVRERFRIRGKIKVLTAEGRIEAAVLLALPPVVFFMIYFLNRNYAEVLLRHPNLIYSMIAFMLLGVLWIRRIVNFDF